MRTPAAGVTPDSIYAQLPADSIVTETIWLTNTGTDTLHAVVTDVLPQSRATGGPDAFGYIWSDSDDPDGPVYDWFDISGAGTQLSLYDDDDIQIMLPFQFPFYGELKQTVRINSNGYLSFGWSGSEWNNAPIPGAGFPNYLICAFWDDLKPLGWDNGYDWGSVYYQADPANDRFIIQYENVSHFHLNTPVNPETFQIILYQNGEIVMQYESLSLSSQCTVGLENNDGSVGLEVVFNDTYLHNGLAIRLYVPVLPDWLDVTPQEAVVAPGESVALVLDIDATDMPDGPNARQVNIVCDDPNNSLIEVPVVLNVATPVFGPVPDLLDFGQVPVYVEQTLDFSVHNTGGGVLTGMLYCPEPFAMQTESGPCDSLSFALSAGDSLIAPVSFTSVEAIPYVGNLVAIIEGGESHDVPLVGEGYWLPCIDLQPAAIELSLASNTDSLIWLQVGNTGTGTLEYSLTISYPLSRDSVTLMEVDFDECIPDTWTIVDGGNSADTWECVADYNGQNLDGTPFAFVNSDAAGNSLLDEMMISPMFNVASAQGLYLEFDHFFYEYDQGGDETGDVDVWNGVYWQNVYRSNGSAGTWNNPQHVVLNILDHVNGELRFRFHYYNAQWDWYWAVDNVKLWGYCSPALNWVTINDGTAYTDSVPMNQPPNDLMLRFNAQDLDPGVYQSELRFASNDPVNPVSVLPVTLTVTTSGIRPQNIAIEVMMPDVQLSWDAVHGVDYFRVFAAPDAQGPWNEVFAGALPTVDGRVYWSEPLSGNKCYYRVTAVFSE